MKLSLNVGMEGTQRIENLIFGTQEKLPDIVSNTRQNVKPKQPGTGKVQTSALTEQDELKGKANMFS